MSCKIKQYLDVMLLKVLDFDEGDFFMVVSPRTRSNHQVPLLRLDGHLKLPISSPIGCSRFDWFVINSSYCPVEQDGWRHAFVPLTHYPIELCLWGGQRTSIQSRAATERFTSTDTHTHINRYIIANTHSDAHTRADRPSQCSAGCGKAQTLPTRRR